MTKPVLLAELFLMSARLMRNRETTDTTRTKALILPTKRSRLPNLIVINTLLKFFTLKIALAFPINRDLDPPVQQELPLSINAAKKLDDTLLGTLLTAMGSIFLGANHQNNGNNTQNENNSGNTKHINNFFSIHNTADPILDAKLVSNVHNDRFEILDGWESSFAYHNNANNRPIDFGTFLPGLPKFHG